MSEKLILTGIAIIIVGVLIALVGGILSSIGGNNSTTKTNFAVGGFIGPIPFGFFSSKGMFWAWLAIISALFLIWILIK